MSLQIPQRRVSELTELASQVTTMSTGKQDKLVSGTNIKTINGSTILGSGNLDIDGLPSQSGQSGKFLTTNGSAASWSAVNVPTKTSDLTNDSGFITSSYHDSSKQDKLTSGTNIKTINSTSVLGSGNISVATAAQGAKADTALQSITGTMVNTALGYTAANDSNVLKLSGDQTAAGAKTFTGSILQIQNDANTTLRIKDPEADYTVAPSAQRARSIDCIDKNGKILGNFQFVRQANGDQETQLLARNKTNGTQTSAYIRVGVKANGNQYAVVPAPTEDTTSSTQADTVGARNTKLQNYQPTLVSGTNIKSINGNSLLGSGNLTLDGLPAQSGQNGKFLTTNGSAASWAEVTSATIRYWD